MNITSCTYSIVRSSQGSWKWQTPYVVKGYKTEKAKNGFIYFRPNGFKSPKLTYERALAFALNISGDSPVFEGGLNNIQPWQLSIEKNKNFAAK